MGTNYVKPSVEDECTEDPGESSGDGNFGDIPWPPVTHFLTDNEFNRAMDTLIPLLNLALGAKQIIRDSMFTPIAEKLQAYGKGEWSLRPRTFAILRMLGCPELMDMFIREHRQDISLPYTARSLPDIIKGQAYRSKFLEIQNLVLPLQQAKELELGEHVQFRAPPDQYFQTRRLLDEGGDHTRSIVDHVYSTLSLKQYARKRISRRRASEEVAENLSAFKNDLNALKILVHRHIVRLVGSYMDPRWFGLIMTPVADEDLDKYLTSNDGSETRKQHLRVFFGCLAGAVCYLHEHNTCHGDLKPRNMLVKDGKIHLTDFGSTRLWEDDGRSTTKSVAAFTQRYCAQEVANFQVNSLP
jgi:hypothetical protein